MIGCRGSERAAPPAVRPTVGRRPRAAFTIEYRPKTANDRRRERAAKGDVVTNYSVDDPFGLAGDLTAEEQLIASTVRDWVRRRFLPIVADAWRAGALPSELGTELGELGVLGMHLEGYGCAGTSATAYGRVCLELEAGDSGLRSFVSVQGSLAMFAIHAFGSEEQKERWLEPMAAGEVIGCFGLTEPDAGSDPGAMRTSARRDRDAWVLNGTKMWITNGSRAGVAVVWAKTDEGVKGFLVPAGSEGFSTVDVKDKLSLVASTTSELVFEECRLGDECVLPAVSSLRGPLACLSEARYGIVWGAVGAARACLEAALSYTASRVQFGRPIAARQIVQQELVEMHVAVNNGLLLATRIGRLKDEGRATPEHISYGKFNNVRMATDVARRARALLGANGITLEYPVMRHLVNLESVLTYEGTHQIHTLVLGKALTGHAAFE
jgi:glutaryl-CoA dehydrogenase